MAFPSFAKASEGQAFGSRFYKRAPTIPQSLTQPAKLSKSLYNPTFTPIFVQILYHFWNTDNRKILLSFLAKSRNLIILLKDISIALNLTN